MMTGTEEPWRFLRLTPSCWDVRCQCVELIWKRVTVPHMTGPIAKRTDLRACTTLIPSSLHLHGWWIPSRVWQLSIGRHGLVEA